MRTMTETSYSRTATGTFEVHLSPQTSEADGAIYRFGLTKTWTGDITAEGRGVMMSGGDPANGNAGYVAIELVVGTLEGREGTFLLQQFGDLDRGAETLHYQVVNGSGTGALADLRGRLDLTIDDSGVHRYTLQYDLPDDPTP